MNMTPVKKALFISPEERLGIIRNRSYSERFDMLMRLIKISRMLQQVKKNQ